MLPLTPQSRRLSRRGGNRTHDLRLIRTPLSPLSYAPAVRVGPEGIEPTPAGLKVRCAACYATTLCLAGRIRFNRRACNIVQLLVVPCSSGSPESRTQRDLVISQVWATGPRLPCCFVQVGMVGLEPTTPCSHDHRCAAVSGGIAASLHPVNQNGRI